MTNKAEIEPLRSLAYTSISGSYAAVGTASAYPTRIICFTNTTDADMIFSRDNTLVAGELIVAAGGFKLFDITTNHRPVNQDDFCFQIGTQWYVRQGSATTKGSVYIEMVYAQ